MPPPRTSITYTALIWFGMLLCLFGAVVAVVGVGGSTSFELSYGDLKVKTTQVGLSILVVGAALAGIVAVKLPSGVKVLAQDAQYTVTERIARKLPWPAIITAIGGIILLVIYSLRFR